MKVTIFTSNQARHISYINEIAKVVDEVFAVQECNTLFPGQVEDFFKKTPVMTDYFTNVLQAEEKVFGRPAFLSSNVNTLAMKMGDLSKLELGALKPALESDIYLVFGSSFIKNDLCEFLVNHKTLNIHMGISPYYRGSSCNFWALYDKNPNFVGSTVHLLSKGLDSGDMLFHALPSADNVESPFEYTMRAVKAAHIAIAEKIKTGEIFDLEPMAQDKSQEIRYTRNRDFTDEVAGEFLRSAPTMDWIKEQVSQRSTSDFLRIFVY